MNKKLLLTSTFLSSLPLAFAHAESPGNTAPHLTISGSATFHAAFMSQDIKSVGPNSSSDNTLATGALGSGFNTSTVGKGQGFAFDIDDSYIDFAATGKTDGGIDYMMRVNMDAVPGNSDGANNYSAKKRVRQTYVQLHGFGFTVIGGTSSGVETTMTSDASNIMHGDGGFAGGWSTRFNEPAAYNNTPSGNMLYGAYLTASTGTANKMTLTTPRFWGVQLGYSFVPNSKHEGNLPPNNLSDPSGGFSPSYTFTGSAGTSTGTQPTITGYLTSHSLSSYFDKNVSAVGVDFSKSFGDFSVDLAGNFIVAGQTQYSIDPSLGASASPYKKSSGWSTGLTLSYAGFDLSGGYFNNRSTGVTYKDAEYGADGGKVWNVGASYTQGAFAVAVGYLYGKKTLAPYDNTNNPSSSNSLPSGVIFTNPQTKAKVYSLTLDYRLAEGLTTYIDANYAKMEDPSALTSNSTNSWTGKTGDQPKNKGGVVLIGTRITI